MSEETSERAGIVALIFSFLMPIVGVICYFVNKDKVENPSSYLFAALAGFVIGLLLRFAGA